MQDSELLRYSRHILLDDIGIEGQTRITQSRVLIVGAGGLGSSARLCTESGMYACMHRFVNFVGR